MKKVTLGKTQIDVTPLCIGALTVSPVQRNFTPQRGGEVLAYALEKGINFIDTAQYYGAYKHIRRGLEISGKYDTVISTKSYAYDRKSAQEALDEARRELNRDYIDIFMLHEQESADTLRGHREAYDFFFEMKEKGIIRAVGVSTHRVECVKAICDGYFHFPFDLVFAIYNKTGIGIADGSRDEMKEQLVKAKSLDIATMDMKALGGGNLIGDVSSALNFVIDEKCPDGSGLFDVIALGMQNENEVDADISYFESRDFGQYGDIVKGQKRELIVEEGECVLCGKCVSRCGQGAISIVDGKIQIDKNKCVLCGYCSKMCGQFAIKVI